MALYPRSRPGSPYGWISVTIDFRSASETVGPSVARSETKSCMINAGKYLAPKPGSSRPRARTAPFAVDSYPYGFDA